MREICEAYLTYETSKCPRGGASSRLINISVASNAQTRRPAFRRTLNGSLLWYEKSPNIDLGIGL